MLWINEFMFNDSLIAFWLSKKDIFFRLLEVTFFFIVIVLIIYFYYNQKLLKNLINAFINYINSSSLSPKVSTHKEEQDKNKKYEIPKQSNNTNEKELNNEMKEMENKTNKQNIKQNVKNESNISLNSNKKQYKPNDNNNSEITSDGKYCYIGENKGYRSCIKIEDSDKCMSGDIFPSMDVCINPSLRY